MKKSVRGYLMVIPVLAALAFSTYGVALAAPSLHFNGILQKMAVAQSDSTETVTAAVSPEVTDTAEARVNESAGISTPEPTEAPNLQGRDSQGAGKPEATESPKSGSGADNNGNQTGGSNNSDGSGGNSQGGSGSGDNNVGSH